MITVLICHLLASDFQDGELLTKNSYFGSIILSLTIRFQSQAYSHEVLIRMYACTCIICIIKPLMHVHVLYVL